MRMPRSPSEVEGAIALAQQASPPAPLQKERGAGKEWLIVAPLQSKKSRALPVLST